MHPPDHATTLRRVVLACALVVVALPGNGRGWFGTDASSDAPTLTIAWGSVVRDALGPDLARGIPTMRPIAAPTSWPAPVVTPTTLSPLAPSPAPEPVAAVEEPPPPVTPVASPPPVPAPPPAVVAQLPSTGVAVYAHPDDAQPMSVLRGTTEFETPRVMLTTLTTTTTVAEPWIEVYLPNRPNGATGWVRTSSVTLTSVADRITVDLAARTVTWERGSEVVGVVAAAVGAARTPTPTGTYFVTDVLPFAEVGQATPNGDYGAWVVALNGHSDAFTTFEGGDARIAIHGTNDPASIGNAASSGCVRIAAAPLETLARNVPLGTPVVIR